MKRKRSWIRRLCPYCEKTVPCTRLLPTRYEDGSQFNYRCCLDHEFSQFRKRPRGTGLRQP
jgi:hypothetical protein